MSKLLLAIHIENFRNVPHSGQNGNEGVDGTYIFPISFNIVDGTERISTDINEMISSLRIKQKKKNASLFANEAINYDH
jgi:hypothetical protein